MEQKPTAFSRVLRAVALGLESCRLVSLFFLVFLFYIIIWHARHSEHIAFLESPHQVRVLVTGFEPFGNLSVNPAQLVAHHLAQQQCKDGLCVTALHLPVNREGVTRVSSALHHSASSCEWDAVVHLGYESVSKGLRLEIAAANVLATDDVKRSVWSVDVPCNETGTGFDPIDGDAPCLLATTAPLDRLDLPLPSQAVRRHALELWSRDAGTYFCNEIYFRTLLAVRDNRIKPRSRHTALLPVLFIHLPPLHVASVAAASYFVWQVMAAITL